jgi:hypothetical protein
MSTVGASVPLVSVSVSLMALVPYQFGSPTPSMRRHVDSGDDELVDIVEPRLHC